MSDAAAVDPEEAFVASLSSCHMLWFLDIASRAGYAVESYEDAAQGRMGRNAAGKLVVDVVTLRPRARFAGARVPDAARLAALHHEAHEECFLANSVRCEIRCEPLVDQGTSSGEQALSVSRCACRSRRRTGARLRATTSRARRRRPCEVM